VHTVPNFMKIGHLVEEILHLVVFKMASVHRPVILKFWIFEQIIYTAIRAYGQSQTWECQNSNNFVVKIWVKWKFSEFLSFRKCRIDIV